MVLVTAAPTSFSPSETSGGILPTTQRGLLPLQKDVFFFYLNRVNELILNEPQIEPRLAALLWLYALLRSFKHHNRLIKCFHAVFLHWAADSRTRTKNVLAVSLAGNICLL